MGRRARDGDAARRLVHRHLAPAEHASGPRPRPRSSSSRIASAGLPGREEADGHAVAAGLGQLEAGLGAQERVGELDQDAGAVPGVGVGALGSAVLEVLQRVAARAPHLVGRGGADARDEGDAAGVVLVARVVQATGCLQWEYLPVSVAFSAQAHDAERNAKL